MAKLTNAQLGLIGSGVSSAGGLVGGLLSYYAQREENKKNRAFAQQQAQQARDWQIQQWNMENAYNSPSAQMQRFRDAGLNPNLIYGELGNGLNTAPSVPQGDVPSARISPFGNPVDVSPMVQTRLMDAQIEALKAKTENETRMTEAQIERFAHLNNVSVVEVRKYEAEIDNINASTVQIRQGIENMKVQFDILSEQKKQEVFQTAFVEATQNMRIEAANAESEAIAKTAVSLAMAKVLNIKADTALKWSNINLNNSQIRLNGKQMVIAERQADLIAKQITTEDMRAEQIMWSVAGEKRYQSMINGDGYNDTWYGRALSTVLTGIDGAFRCAGQIMHATSVVHQK